MKNHLFTPILVAWLCSTILLSAAEPTAPANLLPHGNFEPAKEDEVVQGWELPPKDWQAQKGFIAPAPDAPPASFGLQPGSPARGAAIDGHLMSGLDLFGTQRPADGKFDCGAMQSSSAKVKETDATTDKPPAKRKRLP